MLYHTYDRIAVLPEKDSNGILVSGILIIQVRVNCYSDW